MIQRNSELNDLVNRVGFAAVKMCHQEKEPTDKCTILMSVAGTMVSALATLVSPQCSRTPGTAPDLNQDDVLLSSLIIANGISMGKNCEIAVEFGATVVMSALENFKSLTGRDGSV